MSLAKLACTLVGREPCLLRPDELPRNELALTRRLATVHGRRDGLGRQKPLSPRSGVCIDPGDALVVSAVAVRAALGTA